MENDRKFLISWNLVDSSQKEKYIPMPCNYLLPMGQKGYSVTFERVGMRKIVSSKQVFLKSWLMLVYPRGWFNTSSCSMRWPQPSMCPVNVYTTRNFMHKMQIFTILKPYFNLFLPSVRWIQIQLNRQVPMTVKLPLNQKWIRLSKLPSYFSFKTLSFPSFNGCCSLLQRLKFKYQ